MTINGENVGDIKLQCYRATLEFKTGGHASVSPVYDEHYDDLTIKHADIERPSSTHASNVFSSVETAKLDINVFDPSLLNEVHWQLSTENCFSSNTTVNVWGNTTRKKNIWYQNDGTIEGIDIDTQAIFQLSLIDVHNKHFESDEQRKWDKPGMNSHVSEYSTYKNGATPVRINFTSGKTYYCRARIRDAHMNWSAWSTSATLTIK